MKNTFFKLLFMLTLTNPFLSIGQDTFSIKGKVIADNDLQPLVGALIFTPLQEGGIADDKGNFNFTLKSETESVTISFLGYASQTFELNGQDKDFGTITLALKPTSLSEIIITGSADHSVDNFEGSSYLLDKKTLELSNPLNTEELLRIVPGVNIVGDMGLSNRPNISIRGSWGRRSKKVLLMEDGTPAAPAPYIAPGAYYNPVSDRVQAIEVYKGADMLRYGPNNMFGGVNYITALPPQKPELRLKLVGGQRNYTTGLFSYGGTWNNLGALVEAVYKKFDGFTDNSSVEVLNLNAKIFAELSEKQSLYFKISGQYEDNQASLSAITPFTFDADPTQNPFDADRFTMRRYGLDIVHKWVPNTSTSLTSKIYATDFERDWWRQVNTVIKAEDVRAYVGEQIYQNRYSYLDGQSFGEDDYVRVGRIIDGKESTTDSRWIFTVSGFKEQFNFNYGSANQHELEASFKLHQESYNNRYLRADSSRWTRSGNPATDQEFKLWSASGYVRNQFNINKWAVTPILRIEHVDMSRQDLLAQAADPNIQSANAYTINNNYTIALPGVTVDYKHGQHKLFSSVYRGFVAPSKVFGFFVERNGVLVTPDEGSTLNIDPELSVNVEVGWQGALIPQTLQGQLTYFNNSIENFVAAGENELFRKPGKVSIQGVEASFITQLLPENAASQLTLDVNGTFMWTKVNDGAVEDKDLFGPVVHSAASHNEFIEKVNANRAAYQLFDANGQEITSQTIDETTFQSISRSIINFGDGRVENAKVPYTPEYNISGRLNYKVGRLSVGLTGNFVGEQYTEFANFEAESADGALGKLPAYFNMDVQMNYEFKVKGFNKFSAFINAKNITNEVYRASRLNRANSGIFPGGFRQTIVGLNLTL
ncbi:TonB-dependent receptor plug domain-containing protein [Roseivirga pacifica]|uniref:TonB-dependent receptor plug domain-containing protein n=1 Tax=Roseivirga pacifica TaxID=1267423 RepID=UPI00227A4EDC|nr:TonB-dependent receptor plug domain-containing protein [Roseivirga pacifica]